MSELIEVMVELPRGGFVKRRSDGAVDFVSPLPCPYNYGSVPGTKAADGDPVDALVLGSRLARGTRVTLPLRGVVRFVDAGAEDLKLVCSERPLSTADRAGLIAFFRVYAIFKRALQSARGRSGETRFLGLEQRE